MVDERFLAEIDAIYPVLGFDSRASFVREAVMNELERRGYPMPAQYRAAPKTGRQRGRPKKSALGAINIGFGVSFALAGSVKWVPCAVGMASCFLVTLGLLATAEVLNRLRDIAESVRRAEK